MTTNDGGSAFPCPESEGWAREHGMSLRDWLAGQALIGLMHPGHWAVVPKSRTPSEHLSALAYAAADAMLKERSK